MNGILLIDKEPDWTSSDVVARMRGILHERRVGHGGTLDPLATGLLILMVGRATRASDDIMGHDKTYFATLRLGVSTDTQDITGTVLKKQAAEISTSRIEEALQHFVGSIDQIPPMYSAIKINGKKLYDIARKGGTVERKARKIHIHKLEMTGREGDDVFLSVNCSSGTYIRTLCHDIGEALGCGACMAALRRVEVGPYDIRNAHRVTDLVKQNGEEIEKLLIPVDSVYSQYPAFNVTEKEEEKLRHGAPVRSPEEGLCRVYSKNGSFLMLGRTENGILRTEKSFFEPEEK